MGPRWRTPTCSGRTFRTHFRIPTRRKRLLWTTFRDSYVWRMTKERVFPGDSANVGQMEFGSWLRVRSLSARPVLEQHHRTRGIRTSGFFNSYVSNSTKEWLFSRVSSNPGTAGPTGQVRATSETGPAGVGRTLPTARAGAECRHEKPRAVMPIRSACASAYACVAGKFFTRDGRSEPIRQLGSTCRETRRSLVNRESAALAKRARRCF